MFKIVFCFTLFISSISVSLADYYDQCAVVLAKGVFNTKELSTDYRVQADFKEFMCSRAYKLEKENIDKAICEESSSSKDSDFQSSGNYLNLISGTGNASIQKNFKSKYCSSDNHFKYGEWSSNHCQSTSSSTNDKSVTHTLIKSASPDVVNAWKACVNKNKSTTDLTCFGREQGELVSFSIDWDHRYASTLKVENFAHPNLTVFGSAPTELNRGSSKLAFERINKKKSSLIQISAIENLNGVKTTISCEYSIPPAACENTIYRKGRSKKCGIEKHLHGKGEVCGSLRYVEKRDSACGTELYNMGSGGPCGTNVINHRIGGGCSQASTYCQNHFGGTGAVNCDEYRGSTRYDCPVPKRCRAPEFGVEQYKLCALAEFGVAEYKECEDSSFGTLYKECRLPEFGVESCGDK